MKHRYSTSLRLAGLALALSLGLVSCGKGCAKQQGAVAEKGSLELLPSDRNVVIGLNWKKINESPLGAKMSEKTPPELAPMLKDVSAITLGLNIQGMDKSNKDFVGIISGNLDSAKLLAQMQEQAKKEGTTVTEDTYEGIKLYSPGKEPDFAVAFVEGKGVFGGKETVKKSIDLTKKKGDSIEKNKPMMDLIGSMDKGKMLWAVGLVPPGLIPAGAGGPGNPMASLAGMKAIDLALDYTENLVLDLGVVTANKENAEQLKTMSNSYKTLFGGSLAAKDPSLGKVLNGLTIDAKEDKVLLSLKLDKATVDELAKKAEAAPGMMPGAGPGGPPDMGAPPPDAAPPPPPPAPDAGAAAAPPSAP